MRARGLWHTPRDRDPVPWQPPTAKPKPVDSGYIERLWAQTRPAPGTLVDLYLRDRCITWAIHPAIRFHPLLPYHHDGRVIGAWPAMVVRLGDPAGDLIGLHRT